MGSRKEWNSSDMSKNCTTNPHGSNLRIGGWRIASLTDGKVEKG